MTRRVLSDRPLGELTLKELIWFLDRVLIPYVRQLDSIPVATIAPGEEGQVIVTDDGESAWGFITDENVSSSAEINVAKLAEGDPDEVLVTVGDQPVWNKLVNANVSAAAELDVAKLAEGTEGDVLTTVAGVPVWQAPSAGGHWQEYLDIDCAAEATLSFATSGSSYTFGGVSWIVENVSGGANNGTVGNLLGTGLVFQPNGNNSSLGGRTCPRLRLDLRQLGPLADLLDGPLRVRVWLSFSPASNFQFFYVAVAHLQSENYNIASGIGYNSGDGGQTSAGQVQHGGVAADYFLNPEALGSKDVIEHRFQTPFIGSSRFGVYGSDWPTIDEPQGVMAWTQSSDVALDAYVQQRDTTLGAGAGNFGLQVVLAAAPNNPAAGFSVTVKRITIDQWRNGS